MSRQMQCKPPANTNSLWASEYITHWLEDCSNSKRDETKRITRRRSKSCDHLESLCKSFTTSISDTRRVHFPNAETDNSATSTNSNQKHKKLSPSPATATSTTKVTITNLPWADENGTIGKYTGEVSVSIRCLPHGHGSLVYSDGRTIKRLWDLGIPIPAQDSTSSPFVDKSGTERATTSPSSVKDLHCLSQKGEDTVKTSSHKPSVKIVPPQFRLGLGDIGLTHYMIIESNPSKAFQSIDSLKIHDFAWVKRSCGTWVYAIVAIVKSGQDGSKKSIKFVLDKKGSSKTFKSKYWINHIRLVNMQTVSSSECLKRKQAPSSSIRVARAA